MSGIAWPADPLRIGAALNPILHGPVHRRDSWLLIKLSKSDSIISIESIPQGFKKLLLSPYTPLYVPVEQVTSCGAFVYLTWLCCLPDHHIYDQCLFCATQPSHYPTSQLCFCSLVFIHYVLILYDYQMVFSPICSAVYAFGLVRLISRCYAVPQCFTHPNRCLLVPGLSIPFGLPFVLACPVLACITLLYWSSLCSCRATVHIPFSYIRIPSSP